MSQKRNYGGERGRGRAKHSPDDLAPPVMLVFGLGVWVGPWVPNRGANRAGLGRGVCDRLIKTLKTIAGWFWGLWFKVMVGLGFRVFVIVWFRV